MADFLMSLALIGMTVLILWAEDRALERAAEREELLNDTFRAIQTRQVMDAETLDAMKALMKSAQTYGNPDTPDNSQK